jgi:uncharacterized membrane protein YphA (DoxX/SURF4 family)
MITHRPLLSVFSKTVRFFLGCVLLWSGASHIGNQPLFLESIYRYEVFPPFISYFVAVYLPFAQAFVGSYLVLGIFTVFSSVASAFLFCSFTLLQASAWVRGLRIDCGCFGPSDHIIDWKSISVSVLLSVVALLQLRFGAHWTNTTQQTVGGIDEQE